MENQTPETEPTLEEKVRIDMLASRIELLFGFCADLFPDIELIERVHANSAERQKLAYDAATILSAAGINYEEAAMAWDLRRKRAKALIDLVKVLRDTEQEREAFKKKLGEQAKNKEVIEKLFGAGF